MAHTTLKLLLTISAMVLPAAHASAQSGDSVTMDVIGTLTATIDGEEREWVTIAGNIDGEAGASANWQVMRMEIPGFADSLGSMMGELSEEEQAQIGMLDQLLSQDGSLGGMIGAAGEQVSLTISGHDPQSPNILREQVMALDIYLGSAEAPLGQPISAEINYFVEAGEGFMPALFYTSSDNDKEASVTFETLDFGESEGLAVGRFEAELCRMEGANLFTGPDLDDCMVVEGQFDTKLVRDEDYEI